jgi:probable rRNA maturation factor
MIHLRVEDKFTASVDEDWLRQAAQSTLDADGRVSAELTVVISDDAVLQELNRIYLDIDAPTDVLSFGGESPGFVTSPDTGDYLGDVVISYPRAEAQAIGHTVSAELTLLVVHGVLHLLGHDHGMPDEQKAMWQQQALVLQRLGLAPAALVPDLQS